MHHNYPQCLLGIADKVSTIKFLIFLDTSALLATNGIFQRISHKFWPVPLYKNCQTQWLADVQTTSV